jgi:hypothetical protein
MIESSNSKGPSKRWKASGANQKLISEAKERLVEVSPHGDGLLQTQAANTTKPKKHKFFFKVHTHDEDVALVETGLGNNTITEDSDWTRTDIDGDLIKPGFEEVSTGKCNTYPEKDKDGNPMPTDKVAKQTAYDGLMKEALRVQELEEDGFKVQCDSLSRIGGFLSRFHYDSRGYATKLMLSYTCCQYLSQDAKREDLVEKSTAEADNSDGDLMNIAGLVVGEEDSALRSFEFFEPGVNKIQIKWTQEALAAEDDTSSPVKWGGATINMPEDPEGGWRLYEGLVRAKDLRTQNVECPFGRIDSVDTSFSSS